MNLIILNGCSHCREIQLCNISEITGFCAFRSRLEPEQSNVSKSPLSPEKSSQNLLDDAEEKLAAEESKGKNKT